MTGTSPPFWDKGQTGFVVYRSDDLVHWQGPTTIFTPPKDFWADRYFWAPEIHQYKGKWYLFATFGFGELETVRQGTQILVADQVTGPYVPVSDGPATPGNWPCIDGTLHVEPDGTPWMVFCHGWLRAPKNDGQICAQRLSPDLKTGVGDPALLFTASQAPWTTAITDFGATGFVTDGPWMYRTSSGDLLLLWSSFYKGNYALGIARSESGSIVGPWNHEVTPLVSNDAGHGMLFRSIDGTLMLSVHRPNVTPNERPAFLKVIEGDNGLILLGGIQEN